MPINKVNFASKRIELVVKNADIRFRNFSGTAGKYNAAGNRNFCLMLTEEDAAWMANDGWKIKRLTPKDPDDWAQPYLPVAVSFANQPPAIWSIKKDGNHVRLDETTVNTLDWAEFENVDLTINPSNWSVQGKEGIKAYLKAMYVTLYVDPFEEKYFNAPDSAASAIAGDEDPSY